MNITKAKLIKGTFLEVSFKDGVAIINKSYPHTEAPPKMVKAFQKLNHHLCDLCEQFTSDGNGDYDNIAARGYSIKGEGEKEGVTLTGVRTLQTGRSITLNSPFIGLEISDSDYANCKQLVQCLDNCRTEIMTFMENNKSQEEIQGKLPFDKTVILSPEKTAKELSEAALGGEEVDVTHLYIPNGSGMTSGVPKKKERSKPSAKEMQALSPEQQAMDAEMPLTEAMRQKAVAENARKNKGKGKK